MFRRFSVVLALVLVAASAGTASAQAERGGFTLLFNMGVGIQQDSALEESAVGLAGLNLGVGGFLTPKVAVMGRFSGTNVSYGFLDQVSGTLGPSLQYWASDQVAFEVGAGMGYWNSEGFDDRGLGLILGVDLTIFNKGKHNLQVGLEYSPVFTSDPVHNFGITFGYQFF